jgi:hypothetical protein
MKQTRPDGTTPSSTSGMRRGKGTKWRVPALVGTLVASVTMLLACLERPVCDECRPISTNLFVETIPQRSVSKIDLLFVIDNSRSMADKQQVLAEAVPDLVRRLVTPDCVDSAGKRSKQDAQGKCSPGTEPEFQAVKDIHIGVITSSLGGPTCDDLGDPPKDPA